MAKSAYIIRIELSDGSVRSYRYPNTANTWVLAGEKQKLAEEFGVPLDDVTVHIPGHGAIL